MARGYPAAWSAIFGLSFAAGGGYVYFVDPSQSVPALTGLPIAAFGVFVIAFGLYIEFVAAPDPPTLREGEEIIDTRHPAQRAAVGKTTAGFSLLLVAGYLYFWTFTPYVYPTGAFVAGLYLFSTGIHAYWTNTLTNYYVTNFRLIKEYRFLALVRQEVPFGKVRGVQERKSIWEALVGLGNVSVASGHGSSLEIVVRNIRHSEQLADQIRNFL